MPNIVILSVGYDPLLSNTRGRVLGTGGYTVVPAVSLQLAVSEFLQRDFDLVILCHSIPIGDRECLAYLFRERSPNIQSFLSLLGSANKIRPPMQLS